MTAGAGLPGYAAWISCQVCTVGMLRGRSLASGVVVWMPSAGEASTSNTATAATADSFGLRSTRSSTAPHTRLSRSACRSRHSHGMRPLSTRSPSSASIAGSTVSEPTTATATTSMVPSAKPLKILLPAKNMPAIAMSTVSPLTSTERPDVAAAASNDASGSLPFARSSRSRLT